MGNEQHSIAMNYTHSSSRHSHLLFLAPARWVSLLAHCLTQVVALPLALAVYMAPLAVVVVLSALLTGWPKAALAQTSAAFALLFLGCVALDLLESVLAIRWRDKGRPIALRNFVARRMLGGPTIGLPLARTSAICAAMLFIAWSFGSSPRSGAKQVLAYGVADALLAVGMLSYRLLTPDFLFRRPTSVPASCPVSHTQSPTIAPAAVNPAPRIQPTIKAATPQDYGTPVAARQARLAFGSIFGMQQIKEKLLEPAQSIVSGARVAGEPPPNGILLHGKPGNGKTLFAEALAGELQLPFVALTYGDVASKWIGEMPRVISNCFAYAKAHAPCVLFIDEIDSFLRSREFGSGSSEDLKITNTLLTEIVGIREHRVVLVGATNYLANLDGAAIREGRFDMKVEITPPDEVARIGILQAAARKYAGGLSFNEEALCYIAKRWGGYSVSRLTAVAKALPAYARSQGLRRIGVDEWLAALREVQGRSHRVPAGTKRLSELTLDPHTADALSLLAQRLRDGYRIERLGGTLPRGVLLHGAAGTGKTAVAHALVLECGWAYVEASGARLVSDPGLLDKIHAEAVEQRPAVLFIDQADDAIATTPFATQSGIAARLRALLAGGEEHVSDVVLLAAIDAIENVEPMLLRAGGFDEQIALAAPAADNLGRVVEQWLANKKVQLARGLRVQDIAAIMAGFTFGEIHGVLQRALNRAILRTPARELVTISREDLGMATQGNATPARRGRAPA
jgi:transitional endoplasmic reticulum ATPase